MIVDCACFLFYLSCRQRKVTTLFSAQLDAAKARLCAAEGVTVADHNAWVQCLVAAKDPEAESMVVASQDRIWRPLFPGGVQAQPTDPNSNASQAVAAAIAAADIERLVTDRMTEEWATELVTRSFKVGSLGGWLDGWLAGWLVGASYCTAASKEQNEDFTHTNASKRNHAHATKHACMRGVA